MPRRVEDFRGLTQTSRLKLLHAVQQTPGRMLQQLADEAGVHVNTAREHMQVLEDEGLIVSRVAETGTRGRPPLVFDPVQQPAVSEAADRYVTRAQSQGDLLRRIDPGLDQAEQLGVAAQHQVDVLYTHLEDSGFEPELETDGLSFELRPCVFHSLMTEQGAVVCTVHANLVRDQLAQVTGPLKLRKLHPFVNPHLCRLTLDRESGEPGGEQSDVSCEAEPGAGKSAPNTVAPPNES